MSKIGPHTTTVRVAIGECPACKKPVEADVTASVCVTAQGKKATAGEPATILLHYGDVKMDHARVQHDCGPQVADPELCGGAR